MNYEFKINLNFLEKLQNLANIHIWLNFQQRKINKICQAVDNRLWVYIYGKKCTRWKSKKKKEQENMITELPVYQFISILFPFPGYILTFILWLLILCFFVVVMGLTITKPPRVRTLICINKIPISFHFCRLPYRRRL